MTRFRSLTRWLCALGLAVLLVGAFSRRASATAVISLTQMKPCPSINGHGGVFCQGNGGPAFDLSAFTTQSIGPTETVGSAGFFTIFNNTGMDVTKLTLDFVGTFTDPSAPFAQCGGGATGIQGSGPKPMTGKANCAVTPDGTGTHPFENGFSVTWTNIDWKAGATFDLQIASFSHGGTNGVFQTPPSSTPEPGTLGLIGIGLVFVGMGIRRYWQRA